MLSTHSRNRLQYRSIAMRKGRQFAICAASAAAFIAASAGVCFAQEYKYSTPTPPGVAAPDTLETRFGTLHFFGGFPDAASADKLYDNLDFQHAVQAYLLALPVVSQLSNHNEILSVGPANT